jgi:type I restriction enzyme S subunit
MRFEVSAMKVQNEYKTTKIGLIPGDWTVEQVGSLGNVRKGKGISRNSVQDSGYPCVRYGEIYTDYNYAVTKVKSYISDETASTSEPISKGDLLFTGSGETAEDIGKAVVYLLDEPGYAGGDLLILQPDNLIVDPLYLSYQWETENIRSQRRKSGQGASIFHLYADALIKIAVPLPPLPEQQKIADILSTVDEHISETESLIEKTKILKQGMMQRLLTKGIGHTEFKDTEIGRIPAEWICSTLSSYIEILNGFAFKSETFTDQGVRVLKISNIDGCGIDLSESAFLPLEYIHGFASYLAQEGNTVIAMTGATTGKVGLIRNKDLPCLINQRVGRMVPKNKSTMDSSYLFQISTTPSFQKQVWDYAIGGAQPNISTNQIGNILAPIPPLPEQRQIASILTAIDDQIDTYKSKLSALTRLTSGLMQQLLTGKIRVKV